MLISCRATEKLAGAMMPEESAMEKLTDAKIAEEDAMMPFGITI